MITSQIVMQMYENNPIDKMNRIPMCIPTKVTKQSIRNQLFLNGTNSSHGIRTSVATVAIDRTWQTVGYCRTTGTTGCCKSRA